MPSGQTRLLLSGYFRGHHIVGHENADLVIAQVNPQMPRTWGDSVVHIDEIDFLVEYEEPILESLPSQKNQKVIERIGHYVNMLVDDGATLQIGFGHLPDAVMPFLSDKKNLESTPRSSPTDFCLC